MHDTGKHTDVVREINRIHSGLLLSAWTATAMNEGLNRPETERRRFELAEGQSVVLDLLAARLSDVYRTLNAE